jgi:hypothetical protein
LTRRTKPVVKDGDPDQHCYLSITEPDVRQRPAGALDTLIAGLAEAVIAEFQQDAPTCGDPSGAKS